MPLAHITVNELLSKTPQRPGPGPQGRRAPRERGQRQRPGGRGGPFEKAFLRPPLRAAQARSRQKRAQR